MLEASPELSGLFDMEATHDSESSGAAESDDKLATILGYLNFSNGTPDANVQRALNEWWESLGDVEGWPELRSQTSGNFTS